MTAVLLCGLTNTKPLRYRAEPPEPSGNNTSCDVLGKHARYFSAGNAQNRTSGSQENDLSSTKPSYEALPVMPCDSFEVSMVCYTAAALPDSSQLLSTTLFRPMTLPNQRTPHKRDICLISYCLLPEIDLKGSARLTRERPPGRLVWVLQAKWHTYCHVQPIHTPRHGFTTHVKLWAIDPRVCAALSVIWLIPISVEKAIVKTVARGDTQTQSHVSKHSERNWTQCDSLLGTGWTFLERPIQAGQR